MDQFIDQLMTDAHFPEDMDPEVRDQVKQDLTSRATEMINRDIMDSMSDDVFKRFEEIVNQENVDAKAVQDFITENVPDREKIAAKALFDFRTTYLGAAPAGN